MQESKEKMWGDREKVPVYFGTLEEARVFVKLFWTEAFDLTKHPEIAHTLEQLTDDDFVDVQTIEAHRTSIRKAMPTERSRGNFIVLISGNHQPLLAEADNWLKSKGY